MEFKDMTRLNSTGTEQEATMTDLAQRFNEHQGADADPETMKGLVSAAKIYGIEKDAIKEMDAKLKIRKANSREKELTLFDMFQAIGITSIKAEGRTYFTRVDTYASVDAAKVDTAFKWIDEIGCDYLIKKTVNAQSLTREVKAFIESGGDTPGEDQGIKMRTENRVSVPRR